MSDIPRGKLKDSHNRWDWKQILEYKGYSKEDRENYLLRDVSPERKLLRVYLVLRARGMSHSEQLRFGTMFDNDPIFLYVSRLDGEIRSPQRPSNSDVRDLITMLALRLLDTISNGGSWQLMKSPDTVTIQLNGTAYSGPDILAAVVAATKDRDELPISEIP